MHVEAVFIILFIVATTVAIAARRSGIPYTVALVVTGLVLGAVHAFEPPHLTRELLFLVFLPGLLFEAAFHLEFRDFWRDRGVVVGLAVPGVVAAIGLVTAILVPVTGALPEVANLSWQDALLFGAVISATDPIAVVGLFKTLGAPRRLAVMVEAESLLNDGTSIVFYTLVLGIVSGASVAVGGLALAFIKVVGGGLLLGIAVGVATSLVIQQVDDPMIEITLTTIAAYGSFVLAEQLGLSGVIGTVTAGMLCGNYGARTGMSPSTRIAAQTFWEYLAFALNSLVFLLIGLQVQLQDLWASWAIILAAFIAVSVGRGLVILGVSGLMRATRQGMPRAFGVVLAWGGLRGALSMVLALSLPESFPHRNLVVTMTFGVVVLSILIQGLTMAPLLRLVGIVDKSEHRAAYDRARGRLLTAHAALTEIDAMSRERILPEAIADQLRGDYRVRVSEVEGDIGKLHLEREQLERDEARRARRHLLLVEKDRAMEAYRRGTIGRETYDALLSDIDGRLVLLDGFNDTTEPEKDAGGPEARFPNERLRS